VKRDLESLDNDQLVTVSGECRYRREEGKVVLLEDCIILKGL
jgi:hypothetical protein